MRGTFTDIAVWLAVNGYAVLPVSARKVPVIRSPHERRGHGCHGECGLDGHGVHDATTDPATLARWGREYPWAQPAIACGKSGLVVVDLDSPDSVAPGPLPDTFAVTTHRGSHRWYTTERTDLRTVHLPGMDLVAGPGYVLAPGAVHHSGAMYVVADPHPPAPAPEWLDTLCAPRLQRLPEQLQRHVVPRRELAAPA